MRPRRVIVAAALAAAFSTTPAHAADEIAALRTELDQAKALVADLETRLAALETEQRRVAASSAAGAPASQAAGTQAAPATVAAPAAALVTPAASPVAAVPSVSAGASAGAAATQTDKPPQAAESAAVVPRAAWRSVHAGNSEDEVHGLLGPPTKIFDLAGRRVWYYYYRDHGAGSVFFDHSGKVSSLQAPAAW